MSQSEAAVAQARAAYEEGAWERALASYHQAEGDGDVLGGEDLERMAIAAWLVGEPADGLFGRACDTFEAEGRLHHAARVALDLVDYHALMAESSKMMGWTRRATRMLESVPEGSGHARLALMQGFRAIMSGRVEEALDGVERAHSLARAHGDEDAEALALSRRAALLLRLGRLEEATADVDEAMLLVHRDRTRPISGAMIYCNTIDFCRNLGDFERAFEWTEAATRWITERRVCGFPGICRVHRAELLRLQGDHATAAAEARAAIELFERHRFRFGMGYALAELGNLHLELGALDDAKRLFHEAEEVSRRPLPGLAQLALRQGDAAGARTMLQEALDERADNPLGRARLLPTMVVTSLALDDLDAARAAADELRETARRLGTLGTQAEADTAAARVHLAAGETPRALRAARAATRAWTMIGACYELAQARELLARAYEASGDEARARIEKERARQTRSTMSSAATMLAAAHAPPLPSAPPAPLPPLAQSLPIREGTILDGKIEIGPVLGVGGMGIVHAAKHRLTGRAVAVKVLKPAICGDARHCSRFLREAKACGRIRHPNVVDIYDAGVHGQEPYIVMERLEGRSLDDMLADGDRPSLTEALSICEQAARGLSAAHAAGVIHRDLKPGNVFVGERGVKVLDFGICKHPEGGETQPGQILGTPFYMAPEQVLRPDQVDARTDVYALGAVLFELVAGRPPHVEETVHAMLYAIAHGEAPDLRAYAADVPDAVEALVRRALARDPADRFATAAAMGDALADARGAGP